MVIGRTNVPAMFIARLSHWEVRGGWVGRRMVGGLIWRLNWRLVRGLAPYLVGRVIVRMSREEVHVNVLERLVDRLFALLLLG